jgi:hypothetical protein
MNDNITKLGSKELIIFPKNPVPPSRVINWTPEVISQLLPMFINLGSDPKLTLKKIQP